MGSDQEQSIRSIHPWRVGVSRVLARTRVFTLYERWCESATNPARAGHYAFLDALDWVNVVAITRDQRLVMIEQYRAGVNAVTIELAGGIIERGEDPATAGERELLEETGYAGVNQGVIGVVSPNPAILANRAHTVLVTDCELRGEQELDGNEEISVRVYPLRDVEEMIRRGEIHHALVVAALHHLSLRSKA
jgi:8-oxo-dGTP pyrophosphatase MutT (NUDIX family)